MFYQRFNVAFFLAQFLDGNIVFFFFKISIRTPSKTDAYFFINHAGHYLDNDNDLISAPGAAPMALSRQMVAIGSALSILNFANRLGRNSLFINRIRSRKKGE